MTKTLITSALPYANGSIHLGHLVEHVQTDAFVRAARLRGEDILYVCADDVHGTGVELNALKQGITPQELAERSRAEHLADFRAFGISHDVYGSTDSAENRAMAERIYLALREGGHIERRRVAQMYSEGLGRFLTDRMVRGTCPRCGAKDQYGDVCEACGSTYAPTDLIDPVDAIEGKPPVVRETEHLYVRLRDFVSVLETWLPRHVPQDAVRNYVQRWIEGGLEDWCISRDAPYFGFEIPGEPGKYFYVWLDAPVGYISSTMAWCEAQGVSWEDYWGADSDARILHVIGKDIVYFHTLFWPAMLHAAGLRMPERVHVHGMLTVQGEKMSKSRGTFIRASTYLRHLDPDYLRFYLCAKLSDSVEDMDFSATELVGRVNGELFNNLVNLVSRVTKFVDARFGGVVPPLPYEHELFGWIAEKVEQIDGAYARFDHKTAIRVTLELGDRVNEFFQASQPWVQIKTDPAAAGETCALALHACVVLMTAVAPATPGLARRFAGCVGLADERALGWHLVRERWMPERLAAVDRWMEKITEEQVMAMIEDEKAAYAAAEGEAGAPGVAQGDAISVEAFGETITFEDFAKVDLRVGVVRSAEEVEGAKKLLRLSVDCGRVIQVFAGVRSAYPDPSVLVGRRVIVVANLAPRKMRFGVSEGMLLATSAEDGEGLSLVHPPEEALGGWTVR